MLDGKFIRENTESVKKALKKKRVDPVAIDNIISLDAEKRNLIKEVEELQAKRNRTSKEMPGLSGGAKKEALAEMQYVKERLFELESKLKHLETELENLLQALPNPPLESVPEGQSDANNEVIKTVGHPPKFDFTPVDHAKLGTSLDLIDIETAAANSGSRFAYLKNDAVLWEFNLIQWVLQKLMQKGFTPVIPPVLVKEHAMFGTGFFPADRNEIYHVNPEDDDLFLVGTSEVALCMLHAGHILAQEDLPRRYVGFSTCFRREAGTYGKDTHGIFRVHQFDKIEMFSFCHPEKSEAEHEFLLSIEEEIIKELGLAYRVVNICGGELGAPAAKKYDLEAWFPSQNKYRELTSASNCTDFQARRTNIRFKDGKGNHFVHTLNGTAIALGRTIAALMENFQQKDGTVYLQLPQPQKLPPHLQKRS